MGLHDRISRADTKSGDGTAPEASRDPYAELKAKVHHACIAKIGPELYREEAADLAEHVYRVVTEELTLAGTPLGREERRQLVRQLTDDILGYGPLEIGRASCRERVE